MSDIVVAGGHESMGQAPHCVHLSNGTKMGSTEFIDTMLRAGCGDAFDGYLMGNTVETCRALSDLARPAGRLRRRLPGQGRACREGGHLCRGDRPRYHQDQAGQDGRRH